MEYLDFNNPTRHPEDGVSVHAGFPNAGSDANTQAMNLQLLLVPRPISTYIFRVAGNDWVRYGVFDGDIAVVDRAPEPTAHDLVTWWHDSRGEFAISRRQQLPEDASVWGCVTSIIHQTKRKV